MIFFLLLKKDFFFFFSFFFSFFSSLLSLHVVHDNRFVTFMNSLKPPYIMTRVLIVNSLMPRASAGDVFVQPAITTGNHGDDMTPAVLRDNQW